MAEAKIMIEFLKKDLLRIEEELKDSLNTVRISISIIEDEINKIPEIPYGSIVELINHGDRRTYIGYFKCIKDGYFHLGIMKQKNGTTPVFDTYRVTSFSIRIIEEKK